MEAETFDAYLRFGRLDADGEFEEVAVDDDGGGGPNGTDARLRVRVPNTGAYELRATSLGEFGSYRLTLSEGVAPAETASREPIQAGEVESGTLTDGDAVRDGDEMYYDYWLYEGRAGERITINLSSSAFDTYLTFGRLDGETFEEIESNDDAPGDTTDSELGVTLPSAGTYAIRASSYGEGVTGDYVVEVTRR
jgi:serine protease Do